MFRIKGGKIIGDNLAFMPPDNFFMAVRLREFDDDGFRFISIDGSILITLCLERDALTAEEELDVFGEENNYYKLSGYQYVKRGSRIGVGMYFGEYQNSAVIYKEFHNFKKNEFLENQTSLTIEVTDWRRTKVNPVYEVLGIPQVKAFLDSVEYFA